VKEGVLSAEITFYEKCKGRKTAAELYCDRSSEPWASRKIIDS